MDAFHCTIPSTCSRRYGPDLPENYRLTPMCQYFACDADPILESSHIPIDAATKQLCELVPNGPLLDYLRMPYQTQQLREEVSPSQWLELREQEVRESDKRMKETAQQERVGIQCICKLDNARPDRNCSSGCGESGSPRRH